MARPQAVKALTDLPSCLPSLWAPVFPAVTAPTWRRGPSAPRPRHPAGSRRPAAPQQFPAPWHRRPRREMRWIWRTTSVMNCAKSWRKKRWGWMGQWVAIAHFNEEWNMMWEQQNAAAVWRWVYDGIWYISYCKLEVDDLFPVTPIAVTWCLNSIISMGQTSLSGLLQLAPEAQAGGTSSSGIWILPGETKPWWGQQLQIVAAKSSCPSPAAYAASAPAAPPAARGAGYALAVKEGSTVGAVGDAIQAVESQPLPS